VVSTSSTSRSITSACDDVRDAGDGDLVDGIAPTAVARPRSTEEVSEVMRAAATDGLTVVPRGNGTKMSWGLPPSSVDVVVDVSGMNQVLDHQAGDLIVETQAGTRLADVQDVVGKEGQRLVLDEVVPGASIGGTLATNTSGPRRVQVGTARDLLIGITMVRADGVVAKAGGRVVKNVAGYDLGKLLIGSFGTLGVITEALFRLHPTPEASRSVAIWVADAQEAHRRVHQVLGSQCVPGALEVVWPSARSEAGQGIVCVGLEGRARGVQARVETVLDLWGSEAGETESPLDVGLPWDTTAVGDDRSVAVKLGFALSGLAEVLETASSLDAAVHLRGSAGAGVVYAALDSTESVSSVVAAVDALREVCTRHGGSVVVLDAPTDVKQALDVWGPVPAIDLMRRVKDQFDADHRLAPGRFVGGI
jgi:glycolate oxidase FAD binding subunit